MDETIAPLKKIKLGSNIAKYITASGIIVSAAAFFFCNYSIGLSVQLNDHEIAKVADRKELDTAVETAQDEISDVLGYEYDLKDKISVNYAIINNNEPSDDIQKVEENIYENVEEIKQQYVITVQGEEVGSVDSPDELESAIEQYLLQNSGDNTISAEIDPEIDYEYKYASSDLSLGSDELTSLISTLPVVTVEEVTYEEETPYNIEYLVSDSMYEEEWELSQSGEKGLNKVTAKITYIDGEEQEREIIDTSVITESVTEIIYVGTLELGTAIITGSFNWPVSGTITSNFGPRNVSVGSSNHKGIDIACASGTPIYAADGGEVIFAGAQSGYGNLVIIQHKDGLITYYAHCNSLGVSTGDVVSQGDEIATVGSTGTATGYHLHFEIRVDDNPVNPLEYLP